MEEDASCMHGRNDPRYDQKRTTFLPSLSHPIQAEPCHTSTPGTTPAGWDADEEHDFGDFLRGTHIYRAALGVLSSHWP